MNHSSKVIAGENFLGNFESFVISICFIGNCWKWQQSARIQTEPLENRSFDPRTSWMVTHSEESTADLLAFYLKKRKNNWLEKTVSFNDSKERRNKNENKKKSKPRSPRTRRVCIFPDIPIIFSLHNLLLFLSPATPPFSLPPVSYTHLTLPTIYSV